MSVVIETTVGDFTVDLYVKQRPRACLNFLKLCKIKYYNLCLFHNITSNYMAQTGDPTGTGRGGESMFCKLYGDQAKFFEMEKQPKLKHSKLGQLSMVNNGHDMCGSQFMITLSDNLDYLDDQHCVFGEVVEGFEVLTQLNSVICGEDGMPFQDIRICHTVILDDPFDDPEQLLIPPSSPIVTKDMLKSERIACYEDVDDAQGKTLEEIMEEAKEKEAKAQATILEIIGDLPDADMAPPENVLFVCKLNPVTNDDDLELIFSQFGKIVSCEVIRDFKTKESLQYAFIEFADREACEKAYFKMDNVLIDDRRIHVDFSQSVAKVKWKGKGRGVVGGWKDEGGDRREQQKKRFQVKDYQRKDDRYQLILEDDGKKDNERMKDQRRRSTSPRRRSPPPRRERSRSPRRRDFNEGRRNCSPQRSRVRSISPIRRNDSGSYRGGYRKSPVRRRSRSRSADRSRRYKSPVRRERDVRSPVRRRSRSPIKPRRSKSRSPVRSSLNKDVSRQRSPTTSEDSSDSSSDSSEDERKKHKKAKKSKKKKSKKSKKLKKRKNRD